MTPTLSILVWGLAFLATHLVPTHTPTRRALVDKLGTKGFLGLYSLVSLATVLPFEVIWWRHRHAGPLLWDLRGVPGLRHVVELIVLSGFALMLGGVLSPAPSSHYFHDKEMKVRGVVALTRHPLMVGISLWALGHLLMNGWAGDVAFFGIFAATALLGALHQDARKSAENPNYAAIRAQTTFLPVPTPSALAAVGGRGWAALAGGAFVGVVIRMFHPYIFG